MISIIIINYKNPDLTIQCIDSILEYTKDVDYEIVLVDNESQKSDYEKLVNKYKNNKLVNIIKSEKNLGFGGGNNLGVKNARGNFYFFLNNDTIFFENSLKILLDEYISHTNIGFIQPRLYLDKQRTKLQITCAQIPSFYSLLQENLGFLQKINKKNFLNYRYTDWDRNSDKFVGSVCGAAMMCSRKDFESIGGFDERFFMYFEEYDLHTGIKKLGKKCLYTTKTSIIHLHNQSPKPSFQKKKIYIQSAIKYISKHFIFKK